MFVGHQTAGLMRIITYLMQRDQLIRKRAGILIDIFVLETNGIVQIWTLGHWMMSKRIQMWRHRIDGRKRRIGGGCFGNGFIATGGRR